MRLLNDTEPWLTKITGDPFADTGAFVIEYLYQQPHLKDKTILELIQYVADIYVNRWGGKLNAFFLNSTITQPAFKGQRKIDETIRYYRSLIDETAQFHVGFCRLSGQETKLYPAGRDNHILSGSGTFINFHHGFENGLLLSKEALIRMFFVPLGLIQLSDKIALVSSNQERVSRYFVQENCKKNLYALSTGISEGILKSKYNNPTNALFAFADSCMDELDYVLEDDDTIAKGDISLILYHFTNFGASPEVVIYELSADIFRFYAYCHSIRLRKDWTKFVRAHYRNSKFKEAVFIEETEVWQKGNDRADFDSYQMWKNQVFESLLAGKSLLGYFKRWSKNHVFPIDIIARYLIQLKNMEKRTVQKVKGFADYIVGHPDGDFVSKSIKHLNGAKRAYELRQFLIKLNSDNYNRNHGAAPLITVEEYVDYLFPENGNWSEVRDLLLIAIFQKLHELNMAVSVELPEETEMVTEN